MEKLLNLTENLETIEEKYGLTGRLISLKHEHEISTRDRLIHEIESQRIAGRTLKIGIIGRVKSGKSSLINALIFEGNDVLPKAATPMTAALTVLKYGERLGAEVEFIDSEDLRDIKDRAEEYESQRSRLEEEKFQELRERQKSKIGQRLSEEEIRQKAINITKKELNGILPLSAAKEQYESINQSRISLDELSKYKSITANTMEELNARLKDYVGADGKYTPFTKSVTLFSNRDSLKDIEIIDTPGINDPIISREMRTKELLKTCDVVLVVSPSGQFLSTEDMSLLDRVVTKNGIREIFLVASKVDEQLYGDIKSKSAGKIDRAIQIIRDTLTKMQQESLRSFKDMHPEVDNSLDDLITAPILLTSSVAFSLSRNLDNPKTWDEQMQHSWGLLAENYPGFSGNTLAILESLTGVKELQGKVQQVAKRKEKIQKEKNDNLIKGKYKNLQNYKDAMKNLIQGDIEKLQTADIDDLKSKHKHMQQTKEKAIHAVSTTYYDQIDNLELSIKELLYKAIDNEFKGARSAIKKEEATESYSRQVKVESLWNTFKGFFSWAGAKQDYETRISTRTVVQAGYIREHLQELVSFMQNLLEVECKKKVDEHKKNLRISIISTARKSAGDDMLDADIIAEVIRGVLEQVILPGEISECDIPRSLMKSGKLTGSEAESFMSEVLEYLTTLQQRLKKSIGSDMDSFVKKLKEQNLAKKIFMSYDEAIAKLLGDLENKERSLNQYRSILKEIENAKS